jgi:23S rRNA (uridine2552-2'-O)-methyltransferase
VVLSDMAPGTTGNRFSDHMRSMELCHRVLQVGDRVLRPGGALVCKAFEGEDIPLLAEAFRSRFGEFRRIKPKGTRTESVELFFIGLVFRGAPPASETSVDAEHPPHDEPTGDRG